MADAVLVLRGFGVAFGGAPILAEIDLSVPRAGMVVLMGPSGAGKSTLLRTLAGLNEVHPSLSRWGTATLDGAPLFDEGACQAPRRIDLVTQHARFFTSTVRENLVAALSNRSGIDRGSQTRWAQQLLERNGLAALVGQLQTQVVELPAVAQRQLAIVRATAADPLVLMVDETTSGLDEAGAAEVLALLRLQASMRAVMFVTHNQRHARASGGTTLLLAGGRIVDSADTSRFFDEPKTDAARRFVATGGSSLPGPSAAPESLDEDSAPPPPLPPTALAALHRPPVHPRGFFWVQVGRLGGLPRPGLLHDLATDLSGLRQLGVTVLVTLEETATVDPALLAPLGIASKHFPVPDMGAPLIAATWDLCADLAARMAAGAVVAFHCRAGLGRTGTLLASQLIWGGETALRAIDVLRRINARCIQSDDQVRFLRSFEDVVHPRSVSTIPPAP